MFCKAFPKSVKQFKEPTFLQYLSDLTSEWITGNNIHCIKIKSLLFMSLGVKSQPEVWKKWPMAALGQSLQFTESEERSSFDIQLRKRDSEIPCCMTILL